ncbi:MAG: ABC transporter substrate-binding protein [Alphaproteobacteria bacterium]|nr:ABC transporter substrate-binding protein [Alphaproteobacteria bacterium]
MFRKTATAVALLVAALAVPLAPPTLAQTPKIVLAPPGVPPIFGSIIAFVAQDRSFFKKYGVDVELRSFDNGTAASRAVLAGDLDASMSATPLLIKQVANAGVPLIAIYGWPKPDFELGTTDAAKAKCTDLKGQQVGIDTPGGARSIALKSILVGGCHMALDDVQQVALGSNTASAMIAGQIKYGILHLDDVPEIESHGKKVTIIETLRQASPINHWLVIVARKDTLAKKREAFVRMMAGIIAAAHYMADPKNAERVATIAQITGRSHTIALGALKEYLKYGLWAIDNDGLPKEKIEKFIAFQAKVGGIQKGKTLPTYEQLVDASIWRDANALYQKSH